MKKSNQKKMIPLSHTTSSIRMFFLMLCGCSILCFTACTKNNSIKGTASLAVFNAIVGSNELVANFNGTEPIKWYQAAHKIIYGVQVNTFDGRMNGKFNAYSGTQHITFFNYPDTTLHSRPVIDLKIDLPAGTINSLFLTGTLTTPDTLFIRDHLPYHPVSDSSMGLRFVNLTQGNLGIAVNLQGKNVGSEAAAIGYKGITAFKNYAVDTRNTEYVFEIRDASNGNLLKTHRIDVGDAMNGVLSINRYRFMNFTLAVFGVPGSAGPDQLNVEVLNYN